VGPIIPTMNGQQPDTIAEWRKMLEETKREVREIKAIESHLKANMTREEKKERQTESKTSAEEMRDWRWRQNEEMKAFKAAKAQITKVAELRENKQFQEFKRETKVETKFKTQKEITEEYSQNKEEAQYRASLVKAVHHQENELVKARVEDYLENREIAGMSKEAQKMEEEENRAHEQSLEMAAIAREIAKEKQEMLEMLEHSRAAQRAPPRIDIMPASAALAKLS